MKRTYDEYQGESLESIRRNRSIVDKLLSDAQAHDNALRAASLVQQNIANQALQNAVETANMVGKQAPVGCGLSGRATGAGCGGSCRRGRGGCARYPCGRYARTLGVGTADAQ